MATLPTGFSAQQAASTQVVAYDAYVDEQIRRTRGRVKWVEICSSLVTLLSGVLGVLLLAVVVDHWVTPLGTLGRWLFLLAIVLGGGAFFVLRVLPLLVRRIHALYAARTIEAHAPTLKNALVNFLLLRGHRGEIPQGVLQAVEEQAAQRLATVSVDSAVDRSRFIRLGYVLLGLVALAAVYKLASPKDPLETFGRIAAPWADIDAPTRTSIDAVTPGDTEELADTFIKVEARVDGLRSGDRVRLHYVAQGLPEQTVPMLLPEQGYRHAATLPHGTQGLLEGATYTYWITAGDARTRPYTIRVQTPPSISVTRIEYEYPAYTKRAPMSVDVPGGLGNIVAPEGTRVTLHAVATQDIQSGQLDLNCDGVSDRPLEVLTPREARVAFRLLMQDRPGVGTVPMYTSYQLRYVNPRGQENPKPVRATIDIVRDQPPEVEIVSPQRPDEGQMLELPENSTLVIRLRAKDRDYALTHVAVQAERERSSGTLLFHKALLDGLLEDEFQGDFRFVPAEHNLRAGEVVHLWGVARDNRQVTDEPEPNVSKTVKLAVKIVPPQDEPPPQGNPPGQQGGDPMPQPQGGQGQPQQGQPPQGNQGAQGNQQTPPQGNQQGQPQDNRGQPQDNRGGNDRSGQPNGQDMAQEGANGDGQQNQPGAQRGAGDPAQGGRPDAASGDENQPGGGSQADPVMDPNAQSGDVIERIARHIEQQQQNQPSPADAQRSPGGTASDAPQQPAPMRDPASQRPEGSPQGGAGAQQRPEGGSADMPPMPAGSGQPSAPQGGAGGDTSGENNAGNQPSGGAADPSPPRGGAQGPQGSSGGNQGGADSQPPMGASGAGSRSPQGMNDPPGGQPQGMGEPPQGSGSGQQPSGASPQAGGGNRENTSPPDGTPAGQPQPGTQPDGTPQQPMGSSSADGQGSPMRQPSNRDGMGGTTRHGGEGTQQQPTPARGENDPSQTGGSTKNPSGNAGSGSKNGDNTGNPEQPDEAVSRPREKTDRGEGADGPRDPNNAKSPSTSSSESDSTGGESGDRSGGGADGGGQRANQQGTGAPGQNTASDQGSSAAPGQGTGETGSQAGRDAPADRPTGVTSGDQSGRGSQQRPGTGSAGGQDQGNAQGGTPQPDQGAAQRQPQGASPSGEPMGGGSTGGSGDQRSSSQGASPKVGGQPGEVGPRGGSAQPTAPDDPNLEFARRKTELVLEYLKDQLAQGKADEQTLREFGFRSADEARQWAERTEQWLKNVDHSGEEGELARQWLRNLGLRQGGAATSSGASSDNVTQLRETGTVSPPAEFSGAIRDFIQGRAKVRPPRQ